MEPLIELISTLGGEDSGKGVPYKNPSGLASDSEGNIIVADSGNHRVIKIDQTGILNWELGRKTSEGLNAAGTAQGEFNFPQGVCVSADGSIYIADTGNCRIQKITSEGDPVIAFGSWGNGRGQFGGDGPLAITVNEIGNLLVCDSHTAVGGNHRIQKFGDDGKFIDEFGSYGVGPGQFAGAAPLREYGFDFGPDIGPGPIGPSGIVVNSQLSHLQAMNNLGGDIYVADCDNDRILVFYGTGKFAKSITINGIKRPRHLVMDNNGLLYVTGVHAHEPPMDVHNIDDPINWQIEPEARWVVVVDTNGKFGLPGREIAKLGLPEVHKSIKHTENRGLHSHGYGLAINGYDKKVLHVQGGNSIFQYTVDWSSFE